MPSTANLYGYTIYRAVGSSGTFYPADDFRAQNAQGDWITSWIDYFPVVGSGSYYIMAYDFAGIMSSASNTITVVTPPPNVLIVTAPSGTATPSGTAPPLSPLTGPALVYSPTEMIWVPGTVTINSTPQQVPWANGGTTLSLTGNAVGISNPVYQFWWSDPSGAWKSSGNYAANNVYNLTVDQEGVWQYAMYAEESGDASATECWSYTDSVVGVGSVSISASTTSPALGDTVTIQAQANNVSSPEFQLWYQEPACPFDPYGNTGGQWFSSGPYSSDNSFTLYANLTGTYTLNLYCRSTQAPTSENGGQRSLYEIMASLSITVS